MSNLILAFPGSGKTTYVKRRQYEPIGGAVDLDIKGPKRWKRESCPIDVIQAQTAYVQTVMLHGVDVCTYVHAVDTHRKFPGRILSFVPKLCEKKEWLERVHQRGDSDLFLSEMERNWETWLENWQSALLELVQAGNDVLARELDAKEYLADVLEEIFREGTKLK